VYKTNEKNGIGTSFGGNGPMPPLLMPSADLGGGSNSLTRPLRLPPNANSPRLKAKIESELLSSNNNSKEYFC